MLSFFREQELVLKVSSSASPPGRRISANLVPERDRALMP